MRVTVLSIAEQDMESIGDFTAQRDPKRAVSFVRELRDATEILGTFPEGFPFVPGFEQDGVRMHVHGRYVIYYRVITTEERVLVLCVLHSAQDRDVHLTGW